MLNYEKTTEIVEKFFNDCLKHWQRDYQNNPVFQNQLHDKSPVEVQIKEYAIKDIQNLKHDPYSPKGEELDQNAINDFLNSIGKNSRI